MCLPITYVIGNDIKGVNTALNREKGANSALFSYPYISGRYTPTITV